MDNRVRKMVVVDHLVHNYGEILCSVHHGGHPASHHGPPVGEGHGEASPKIQGSVSEQNMCTQKRCVENVKLRRVRAKHSEAFEALQILDTRLQ